MKYIALLIITTSLPLAGMLKHSEAYYEGVAQFQNFTNQGGSYELTPRPRLPQFMQEDRANSLGNLGSRGNQTRLGQTSLGQSGNQNESNKNTEIRFDNDHILSPDGGFLIYSPVKPEAPQDQTPKKDGAVGRAVRGAINDAGRLASNLLWGHKAPIERPRASYTTEELGHMKHSTDPAVISEYNRAVFTPEKRMDVKDAMHPFSKLVYDAGIAHEYVSNAFKNYVKDIYCDPEEYMTLFNLAANDPRIITDKNFSVDDLSTMVNRKMGANFYEETYNNLGVNSYDTNYTGNNDQLSAQESAANTLDINSLDILNISDAKKNDLKQSISLFGTSVMGLTSTSNKHLNKNLSVKERETMRYLIQNLSKITDEKLKEFDPVTRGTLLAIADVAQDKAVLAYLLSPAGEGLLGGSIAIGKEIGKDAVDKLTFVTMAAYYGSDEYSLGKLGAQLAMSTEEFSEFNKKETERIMNLSKPARKVFDAAANAGVKKTTENIIRYAVAEFINSKINPNSIGTASENIKKPVTYGRLLDRVGTPGIGTNQVSGTTKRILKGAIATTFVEVPKNKIIKTSLDTLSVMKAGGGVPKADSYYEKKD